MRALYDEQVCRIMARLAQEAEALAPGVRTDPDSTWHKNMRPVAVQMATLWGPDDPLRDDS